MQNIRTRKLVAAAAVLAVVGVSGVAVAESEVAVQALETLGLWEKTCKTRPSSEHAEGANAHAGKNARCHGNWDRLPAFEKKEDGSISGKWVRFLPTIREGAIDDFTVKGAMADRVVFESIVAALYDAQAWRQRMRGPVYGLGDQSQVFVAFNAPNGAFAIAIEGGNTYTFVVADGLAVEQGRANDSDSRGDRRVVIFDGDHRAALDFRGNGTLVVDGQKITVGVEDKGILYFRVLGFPTLEKMELRIVHQMVSDDEARRDGRGTDATRAALPRGERVERGA